MHLYDVRMRFKKLHKTIGIFAKNQESAAVNARQKFSDLTDGLILPEQIKIENVTLLREG